MTVVSIAQYRFQTRDLSTSDADVASALQESQDRVEDWLNRGLELAQRTEICSVHLPSGYVYPSCTPIVSVSDPTDATIVDGVYLLAVDSDYPNPSGFATWTRHDTRGRLRRTQITYVGGYTPATVPPTLRRALVDLAYAQQSDRTPLVAGAQSVSLGDASVNFGIAGGPTDELDLLVPGITKRLAQYRGIER